MCLLHVGGRLCRSGLLEMLNCSWFVCLTASFPFDPFALCSCCGLLGRLTWIGWVSCSLRPPPLPLPNTLMSHRHVGGRHLQQNPFLGQVFEELPLWEGAPDAASSADEYLRSPWRDPGYSAKASSLPPERSVPLHRCPRLVLCVSTLLTLPLSRTPSGSFAGCSIFVGCFLPRFFSLLGLRP